MIILLHGENSFERTAALAEITKNFHGEAERVDGATLTPNDLPSLFTGTTLFASTRMIAVRAMAENKPAWEALADWVEKTSDDVTVVLVEDKLDKRTRTYKALQKQATVQEFPAWTDRDSRKAEIWVADAAKQQGLSLSPVLVRRIVERAGVDQWRLQSIVRTLATLDEVNEVVIHDLIPARPRDNIFELFETALRGNTARLTELLTNLRLSEDPYMVFGLLAGQVMQLAALHLSDAPLDTVAKDIAAHPYALKNLSPHAKKMSRGQIRMIVREFERSDELIKTTGLDPWLAIERALLNIAR